MDPFYLIQQEVVAGIEHLRQLVDTRDDMLRDSRGMNIDVFNALGMRLSGGVVKLKGLLQDIDETVEQIRQNPESFDISDEEMENRANFVQKAGVDIGIIESKVGDQVKSGKIALYSTSPQPGSSDEQLMRQDQTMATRENTILVIEETVGQQLQMAKEIDHELTSQHRALLDLENGIDNVEDALRAVTQRVQRIIEEEGAAPTYLAVLLSVVVIILLFMAF